MAHGEIVGEGLDRGGFLRGTPKAEFGRERNTGMTGSLKEGPLCAGGNVLVWFFGAK